MDSASAATVVAMTNVDFVYPADQEAQPEEKAWMRNSLLTITSANIRLSNGNNQTEGQVATLIYSSVDSNTIQSMLSIENNTIEQYYDKPLGLGLARVARVRRELELTPKGVKYVTDMMSNVNVEKKRGETKKWPKY
jgi:helix-turn-helix protein